MLQTIKYIENIFISRENMFGILITKRACIH